MSHGCVLITLEKLGRSLAEGETTRSLEQAVPAGTEQPAKARQEGDLPPLPPDAIIIVPVRSFVLFPGIVMPITIGRPRSIAAAQQAVREQRQVGILMQREAGLADPSPVDMYRMGTSPTSCATLPDRTGRSISSAKETNASKCWNF